MKLVRISSMACTSCILTQPIWEDLKKDYNNFEFVEYDYDFDDVSDYNVGNIIPVIIVIKEDKEVTRIIGERTKKDIYNTIEECLK